MRLTQEQKGTGEKGKRTKGNSRVRKMMNVVGVGGKVRGRKNLDPPQSVADPGVYFWGPFMTSAVARVYKGVWGKGVWGQSPQWGPRGKAPGRGVRGASPP